MAKNVFYLWLLISFLAIVMEVNCQDTTKDKNNGYPQNGRLASVSTIVRSKRMKIPSLMDTGSEIERNFLNLLTSFSMPISNERTRQMAQLDANATYNITNKCALQLNYLANGISKMDEWAMEMIDSQFKPVPGVLRGALSWSGNYDECIGVSAHSTYDKDETVFSGQYCNVRVGTASVGAMLPQNFMLSLGVCVPSGCSSNDVKEIFHAVLQLSKLEDFIIPRIASCQPLKKVWSSGAIATLVFLSMIGMLLVVGTCLDIILINCPVDCPSSTADEEKVLLIPNNDKPVVGSEVRQERRLAVKILLCFSTYTNGKKLLNTQQGKGILQAANGVRFLSMSWILLGHIFVFMTSTVFSENSIEHFTWKRRISFAAINNGTLSVDSFFVLRLTIPLALVMLISMWLSGYFYDGPVWPGNGLETDHCKNTWWRNLLYIQNFYHKPMCLGWSWYLAVDMQFFVISPLFIIPLFVWPRLGYAVIGLLLFGTFLATGLISKLNHLVYDFVQNATHEDYAFYIYVKPWCRIGSYLIGSITGDILHRTNVTFRMKWYINLLGWAVAATIGLAVMYGLVEPQTEGFVLSEDLSALYSSLSRTGWALAVSWIIFACCTGNGGFINTILSWSVFQVLSRLTYIAYLIHPIVFFVYFASRRAPIYMELFNVIIVFLGLCMLTFGLSFLLSLAFESPVVGLEKILLKREKRS